MKKIKKQKQMPLHKLPLGEAIQRAICETSTEYDTDKFILDSDDDLIIELARAKIPEIEKKRGYNLYDLFRELPFCEKDKTNGKDLNKLLLKKDGIYVGIYNPESYTKSPYREHPQMIKKLIEAFFSEGLKPQIIKTDKTKYFVEPFLGIFGQLKEVPYINEEQGNISIYHNMLFSAIDNFEGISLIEQMVKKI